MNSHLESGSNSESGSLTATRLFPESTTPAIIDTAGYNEESLPPSYEFTIEQTAPYPPSDVTNPPQIAPRPAFRPPLLNQITTEDANKLLDSADAAWVKQKWPYARTNYTTAAAAFNITGDIRNEAFCLQRLGEVCRITQDFKAARAHIWQAHVLFGRCGEISRQLMCERWLARVASDEGLDEEARLLLHSALDHSRVAGLRESEGWCLLRLGELEKDTKILVQALDIAREEKITLLEDRCTSSLLRIRVVRTSKPGTTIADSQQGKTGSNKSKESIQGKESRGEEEAKAKGEQSLDVDIGPDESVQAEAQPVATTATNSPRSGELGSMAKRLRSWFEKP